MKVIGMLVALVLAACVTEGDDTHSGDDEPVLTQCDDICVQEAQWCDNTTGLWTCGLPEDGGPVCANPDKGCEIQ